VGRHPSQNQREQKAAESGTPANAAQTRGATRMPREDRSAAPFHGDLKIPITDKTGSRYRNSPNLADADLGGGDRGA
jgi:hypothetical protein